jgi:2-(1,2-epoxy-1,2-dihydrophenyl)acetyl-CoA isomerase
VSERSEGVSGAGRRLVRRHDEGPVAVVTLARPERHNALVPELLDDLRATVDEVAGDGAVRALVLAADGPSYSTGGDVAEFAKQDGDDLVAYARRIVGGLHAAILELLGLDIPVVPAVHGAVTGGSLGLVLAGDVVVAGPRASFAPWYVRVGFSPDGGWTALLPRRIGVGRAMSWQLANRTVDVRTAADWGLVDEIHDAPASRAVDVAAELARMRPGAVARTKQLLRHDLDAVRDRLDAELESFVEQIQTTEARDGMTDFLNRAVTAVAPAPSPTPTA